MLQISRKGRITNDDLNYKIRGIDKNVYSTKNKVNRIYFKARESNKNRTGGNVRRKEVQGKATIAILTEDNVRY